MKHNYLKSGLFAVMILMFSITNGQTNGALWTKTTQNKISRERKIPQVSEPLAAQYYKLDMAVLKSKLEHAPQRNANSNTGVRLEFPNADGAMEIYRIMEYSTMAPELQAKFPNIRSYIGMSLEQKSKAIYFSVSPDGLHTMSLSSDSAIEYINPYTEQGAYEVFSRDAVPIKQHLFDCGVVADGLARGMAVNPNNAFNANDGTRRTFRMAVGTSSEYTNFHGGTVASALAAINTIMTRVNGIYDRELSIRMTLVANNDVLISTNANKIFSNEGEIGNITGLINGRLNGADKYDIGHTFTTGSGGLAYLASVCTSSKGGGTTGLTEPSGDPFAVDFVSHEIGHQFGATHTFNGTTGNCSGSNRTSITAYEPGSGSTIMGYAGICSPQNVEPNSGEYFHQASLQQIFKNITEGTATCGILTPTGNVAPTANAGESYNIPISTPYRLTGASADPDGTATHTYTWEQFDLGPAGLPKTTTEYGPMVRSVRGTSNPTRYIPNLADVVADGAVFSSFEKIPSIARVLNFVLTVRDNDPRGGQTAVDGMTVTTIAETGPFQITSQNSSTTWEIGATKKVTWDVANTNVAPISTEKVTIKLSIDGGVTFPYTLASNVPNNGAYDISVPAVTPTQKGRIMVEAVDNIYYDVNNFNINIISVDFLLNFSPTTLTVCQPDNAVFNFVYNTYGGFSQNTVFKATGLPPGTSAVFSPTAAVANGTPVTMTITNTGAAAPGVYDIVASGTSGNLTNESTVSLNLFSQTIAPVVLLSPANGASGLYTSVKLDWQDDINIVDYVLEIATDSNFNTIVVSEPLTTTSYTANLNLETVYYWRVKGSNPCATVTSAVRSFSTGVSTCGFTATATDTPIVISEFNSNTYTSTITVTENLPVTDVNVKVNITHSYASDLRLVLVSPTGATIVLSEGDGMAPGENYTNTVFDQEASQYIYEVTAPFTGSFAPEEDLSKIYGIMSAGDWKLQVIDLYATDGGVFNEFTLQLCLAEPLSVQSNAFEEFSIFPNPNNGTFTLKLKSVQSDTINVSVYDMRGRKIQENQFNNNDSFQETIALKNASAGLYLIKISDGQRSVTKKMLIN